MGFHRIDIDEFATLVSKLRASLPEDVRRAGRIAQNSDKIIEAAQSEAEHAVVQARNEAVQAVEQAKIDAQRVRDEAKSYAQALVQESEINRAAQLQAEEIRAKAEVEAQEIRAESDKYAREVLTLLEKQIKDVMAQTEGKVGAMLTTIQKGRQMLEQRTIVQAAARSTTEAHSGNNNSGSTGRGTHDPRTTGESTAPTGSNRPAGSGTANGQKRGT